MPKLFVAIDLPDRQRDCLIPLCRGLSPETRWTPPEQLHLTLRFIGEVDDHLATAIKAALAEVRFTPFMLRIKGLGCFPPRRPTRILWAGVEPCPELGRLQSRIESRLVRLGLAPEDRPFHPHLTLARLPPHLAPESLSAYLATNSRCSTPPFLADRFHLYSSQLTRHGAIHRLERSFIAGLPATATSTNENP